MKMRSAIGALRDYTHKLCCPALVDHFFFSDKNGQSILHVYLISLSLICSEDTSRIETNKQLTVASFADLMTLLHPVLRHMRSVHFCLNSDFVARSPLNEMLLSVSFKLKFCCRVTTIHRFPSFVRLQKSANNFCLLFLHRWVQKGCGRTTRKQAFCTICLRLWIILLLLLRCIPEPLFLVLHLLYSVVLLFFLTNMYASLMSLFANFKQLDGTCQLLVVVRGNNKCDTFLYALRYVTFATMP